MHYAPTYGAGIINFSLCSLCNLADLFRVLSYTEFLQSDFLGLNVFIGSCLLAGLRQTALTRFSQNSIENLHSGTLQGISILNITHIRTVL